MQPILYLAGSLLVLRGAPPGQAAEPEWEAGFASVKITPLQPVPMAGYTSRTKRFAGIEHGLYAKALVLGDARAGARRWSACDDEGRRRSACSFGLTPRNPTSFAGARAH